MAKLICPNGHAHEYELSPGWTTDVAWPDGTPDPNVHVSYFTCRTCQVDFMLVSREGYVSEVRPVLGLGKYIESPAKKRAEGE